MVFQTTGVYLVGSYCINPEDNYGRLIYFASQISKPTYLDVHDHSSLTVVEKGRVTELCVAASYEPVMQARNSDISSIQTSISRE